MHYIQYNIIVNAYTFMKIRRNVKIKTLNLITYRRYLPYLNIIIERIFFSISVHVLLIYAYNCAQTMF